MLMPKYKRCIYGANKLLSVKNVILDTTANSADSGFTAMSWALAQNCALVYQSPMLTQVEIHLLTRIDRLTSRLTCPKGFILVRAYSNEHI